jgi:fibronectin type III domain protein
MKRTFNGRVLQLLTAAAVVASAIACGNSPAGSTIAPSTASAGPAAVGSPVTVSDAGAGVDLARCFGGGGDAGCFSASRLRAASVASSPVTSSPLNLANVVSGSTVILTWTQPPFQDFPISSYVIEASSTPGGPANLANFNTGNPSTSLTVPGVPSGTYYVRVRALNAAGLSAASNEVAVVVGGAGGGCATAPRSLAVASQSAGTISLAWLAPATGSASSFVLRAGSSPGLSNLADFDTGSAALTFVAPGVPSGSYYVRVYSRSSCGLSAASNEVLVFVVGFSGDVQVSVSWDAPSDVDLHVVEPSGAEIYYGNPSSASGGQLDVDSNPACSIDGRQIENIRWGSRAPGGTYIVRVDYWTSCGVARTNYLVTVRNGPSTQTFTGFFTGAGDTGGQGSGVLITTFNHAASAVAAPVLEMFRAPSLITPSAAKLKASSH